MAFVDVASQAHDRAARVALPIGGEQTRKGRYEVEATIVGHGSGERISGNMARGTPIVSRSSSSHSRVRRSINIVREALVTSVTCNPRLGPPVSHHSKNVSILPKIRSPFFAASRAPGTLSRIQRT